MFFVYRTHCYRSQWAESSKKVSCVVIMTLHFVLIHCKDEWCWLWICVVSVFQLLLMVNPESPPWPSLEFSSQSQQGVLGKFSELPMVYIISLLPFTFSLRRGNGKFVATLVYLQQNELDMRTNIYLLSLTSCEIITMKLKLCALKITDFITIRFKVLQCRCSQGKAGSEGGMTCNKSPYLQLKGGYMVCILKWTEIELLFFSTTANISAL